MSRKSSSTKARRDFLKIGVAGLAALAVDGPQMFAATKKREQPNILLIMSDEHNPRITGCYGNKLVQTPNMDALARDGITFDNHYCNSPLCSPSRASFTAGKYTSRVSAWNNRSELASDDMPSLARQMTAAGYDSYLCGKMHYDRTRRYGFTEVGGNFNDNFKDGGGERSPVSHQNDETTHPRFTKDAHAGEDGSSVVHDRKVTKGAVAFLTDPKIKERKKPFFMLVGYIAPHFPLIVPEPNWNRYKGKVALPEIPDGFLESLPTNYKVQRSEFKEKHVPDDLTRKGRELYYGLVDWADNEIGKVLAALRSNPEVAENTIIIYTSDHGENMGDHGMWWKNTLWEQSARVPLVISYPKRWRGGQRRALASSHVDLVQTMVDLAGGHTPKDWDGDSMVPWLDNPNYKWKDFAVSEYYAHFVASGMVMARTGKWKYVYHNMIDEQRPAERQLFNIEDDPNEFHNLADKPEHVQLIASLHRRMVKELGADPEARELQCRREMAATYDRKDRLPTDKCAGAECRTPGTVIATLDTSPNELTVQG